jgi:hypothetical protein
MTAPQFDSLQARIESYRCDASGNDAVFDALAAATDEIAYLKAHRDFVEQNDWGMGERAFPYMWLLVLKDCAERFGKVRLLEIGVFKGQTLSLWGMIGREEGIDAEISCISPFAGNQPKLRWVRSFKKRFSKQYQAQKAAGSLYYDDDFLNATREIYERFAGDYGTVNVMRGLSTDRRILKQAARQNYEVVYIDGDHSYESVKSDIAWYAPLVVPGGYLVMDDASHFMPTEKYRGRQGYSGYESVGRACETIEPLGFVNVLNVGHNRIYRKGA